MTLCRIFCSILLHFCYLGFIEMVTLRFYLDLKFVCYKWLWQHNFSIRILKVVIFYGDCNVCLFMVIAMYDLSKAFTAPSVRTKPVFFIVEYSSMLFILRYLYDGDCGGRDDQNCDCDGSSSMHVVDLKWVKYNIVVFVLSQTLDLNINNQTSGQGFLNL